MINKDYVCKLGLEFIDEYGFDDAHHSFVFKHNNICVIVDDNICENNKEIVFDYSKYCEMQNKYMATFDKLYRFNYVDDSTYTKIADWLNKTQNDIEIKDVGGSFDMVHTDNTPLEKSKIIEFLKIYAKQRFESKRDRNDFFNNFISRVNLFDDRITIVYNTSLNPAT